MDKNDMIKIECRGNVLEFIKRQLDNITMEDFYKLQDYEIFRKEYMEMAEMIRDKDKFMQMKQNQLKSKNKNINKYFKEK